MVSNDAHANGVMEIWITEYSLTEGGNLAFGGRWTLTPPRVGHGYGDCTGQVASRCFVGKPYQHIVFASPGQGSGSEEHAGQVFSWRACGAGRAVNQKAWIGS